MVIYTEGLAPAVMDLLPDPAPIDKQNNMNPPHPDSVTGKGRGSVELVQLTNFNPKILLFQYSGTPLQIVLIANSISLQEKEVSSIVTVST